MVKTASRRPTEKTPNRLKSSSRARKAWTDPRWGAPRNTVRATTREPGALMAVARVPDDSAQSRSRMASRPP